MTSAVKTPEWVKDAIFYQIFPDRFAFSKHIEKPHNLEAWESPPTIHGFKGGDLYGVIEHLDYLSDLGVNALYFNPIFQSAANHRYHTQDYYRVDPILGGNAAFRALLDAAHARNMRVILDGVFNHASRGFYQFFHALENGAASPYLDWFTFSEFPVRAYGARPNYAAWYDLPALPKFNHANPLVREFIMQVAEHWVRAGIDGWRLDVPSEIDDDSFWREFRTRVKANNPNAYLVGEIWQQADRWLQGDMFDAVMNYQFTRACLAFFTKPDELNRSLLQPESYGPVGTLSAEEFGRALQDGLDRYSPEVTYSQLNLLDSHDTARFLTIANRDMAVLKLALLTMFTFPGAPMLYYGDEIGMEGGRDPDCRRSMIWDPARWDSRLLDTTRRLIQLRKQHPALRRGEFKTMYADQKTYAFARWNSEETIVVALNSGPLSTKFDLPLGPLRPGIRLVEHWTGDIVPVANGYARGLILEAQSGRVWSLT